MANKISRNFYLSGECLELIKEVAARMGVSQAAVVEQAVREYEEALRKRMGEK